MAFGNLQNYETVKTRKDRFATDNPHGVILALPTDVSEEQAVFTVGLWRERINMEAGADRLAQALAGGAQLTDMQALLVMAPDSIGTAFEAKWMSGASKTSWTENCEESAIGRALDNAGYHGNGKCSREEVLKAKEAEEQLRSQPQEDPTGDDDFPSYPEAKPLVAALYGKRGVREFKQFFGHCTLKKMTWEQVVEFAKSQGVDIYNGVGLVQATKLRDMIKNGAGVK